MTDDEVRADRPPADGSAPAKKPRMDDITGVLFEVKSGTTPWSRVYEDMDCHPM